MKKQSPPKPKPPQDKPKPNMTQTQYVTQERKDLEKNLENYTCQLPKNLSQRARTQGLVENLTTCSIVFKAVDQYLRQKRTETEVNNN